MIDGSQPEVFVNEVRWESGVEEVLEASSVFVSTATASLPAAILITRTRECASNDALDSVCEGGRKGVDCRWATTCLERGAISGPLAFEGSAASHSRLSTHLIVYPS